MKKLILLLLSTFVHADDHNHFTIGCVDKIKNKYQIALDLDTKKFTVLKSDTIISCLLYTSPSPRDRTRSRMPSSA